MQANELFTQPNTILLDGGMGTMLQAAGHGMAMINAEPEDREAADAVTGYDNSLIGQSSPIGITTIAHPQEKLGEMAAELILEKIRKVPEEESSVKRLISPELIVRESTAGKNLSTETKK